MELQGEMSFCKSWVYISRAVLKFDHLRRVPGMAEIGDLCGKLKHHHRAF